MREALEAQVALLSGKKVGEADFTGVGKLEDLVREYEAPLRKTTAQIDTDVMRQTLLGSEQQTTQDPDTGRWGIAGTEVVKNDKGDALESSEGRYQIIQTTPYVAASMNPAGRGGGTQSTEAQYSIIDTQTGGLQNVPGQIQTLNFGTNKHGDNLKLVTSRFNELKLELKASQEPESETKLTFDFINPNRPANPDKAGQAGYDSEGRKFLRKGDTARTTTGMVDLVGDTRDVQRAAAPTLDYKSYVEDADHLFNAFEQARIGGDIRSIEEWGKEHYEAFGQAEGRDIGKIYGQDLESAGRRAGFDESGEFLGLSAFGEDIQASNLSRQRERDLQDVARLSPLYSDIMDKYKPGTQEALESAQAVLKAREGDLTGGGAIDAPAPTTPEDAALQDRLSTGMGITAPIGAAPTGYDTATVVGGRRFEADTGYDAATAAAIDPLSAATGYDPSAAIAARDLSAPTSYEAKANLSSGRIGGDYEPSALMETEVQTPLSGNRQMEQALQSYRQSGGGSQAVMGVRVNNEEEFYNEMAKHYDVDVPYETYQRGYTTGMETSRVSGTGDIRRALMEDAYTGLGEGLTAREQENIEQASRRRATALGRAFDRGSIADEVQSRVLEDRNRQAQNRQYAQQVLGQEAGLQTSDMGRNLQAQLANQQAANQAASMGMQAGIGQEQAGVAQDLQAQLANQQAVNRQREYGVGAGLQQEQVGAQFAQQKALSDQQAANQAAQYGVGAGLQQESLGAQLAQQKAMADAQAANQAAQYGVGAGLQQQQFGAGQDLAAQAMNREAAMKGSEFDILQDVARRDTDIARGQQAKQFDVGMLVDQQRLNEQLAQQGTLGYIDAATRLAALEDTSTLDPFQAVLGRTGGGSLQAGQGVFGQAGYGLESSPQYLRPEAGLGFIQNQATNQANMFNAQQAAGATRSAGMMGGLGALGGGLLGGIFGK
jgi:hypothetical protein